jgi:DNA-binding GntR family transcriptional regulator
MTETTDMQNILARFSNEATTADAVCAALRHCIIEGVLRPGKRLLSDELATQLGVSRTPVREALRKLEAEGHVSPASGSKGLVVREYSENDLEEVFFIRELLEGAAARLAADSVSPSDLARMGEFIEDMEFASERGKADVFRQLAGEFHSLVHQASRNKRLSAMLQDLQENIRRFNTSTLYTAGRMADALREHRALYEALKARDGDKAEQLAREHRRKTLAMRRQLIRSETRGDLVEEMSSQRSRRKPSLPA